MIHVHTVKQNGTRDIGTGEGVARLLRNLEAAYGFVPVVVAVVPRMLANFAGDSRIEVVEVDVLVEDRARVALG